LDDCDFCVAFCCCVNFIYPTMGQNPIIKLKGAPHVPFQSFGSLKHNFKE
jgi:hypothetical protein